MDWDLKIPSWDFAELEQHQESNAERGGRGLDLKLGGSGDFGSSINCGEPVGVPTASRAVSGSPSGPSKRARAPSNANQNVACSVDGCKADLSRCRDYHRRHKVCEVHSKTPMVMVGGREQRFCQQCSRFHLLMEFDEVKRSCRKRLDGHNRRRRKPQPDPLNSGSLYCLHQGPRFSSYPHIFPPSAPDPAWAALIKNDEDMLNRGHRSFHLFESQLHSPPNSTFCIFKEGKQFPFLHEENTGICNGANIASPASQPLFSAASSSESCGRKMLSNGLSHVLDADCALSLLSSPSQTPSFNPNPMVSAEGIPYGQPLTQQFGHHCRYPHPQDLSSAPSTGRLSCSGLDAEHIGNILVSDGSDVADLNCHGFYSLGASGTSDGHSEAVPFSW